VDTLLTTLSDLEDWPTHALAGAVITGRDRQPATLERTLASHAQIHLAEGNAVRDSIRQACAKLGMATIDVDGRSLPHQFNQHCGKEESQLKLDTPERGAWRK
jgi:hypothetical protein